MMFCFIYFQTRKKPDPSIKAEAESRNDKGRRRRDPEVQNAVWR